MPRNCVNSPNNFFLYFRRSYVSNTKTSINTDGEKSLWLLFRLQSRRPRQKMGSSCMLLSLVLQFLTDSYFCISSATSARNYKGKKRTVNYPNISSAIRLVPHTEDLPVPVPPQQYIVDSVTSLPKTERRQLNFQHRMLSLLLIFNLTNSIKINKMN